MKKLLISIYILSVMLMLSGCKEEVEYEFLHEQSEINKIEIIRIGEKNEQGVYEQEILYDVEDVDAFVEDFDKVRCYSVYGDPTCMGTEDLAFKVRYTNGDCELITSEEQRCYTIEGRHCDYWYFERDEFNDFLKPYLRKSMGVSIDKDDLTEQPIMFTAEDAAVELNQLYPEGFIVDDTSILDEVLKTEYDLAELQTFFVGSDCCSTFENPTVLSFNEVNEQFPVEVIRPQGYSVYKVSEGGFFYVFWTISYEMVEGKKPCKPVVYFASYIHSELEAEAFNCIEPQISTAQDVLTIDPEAEFNFLMSYGIYSYSILNENEMMEIRYERFGDKFEGYDDLIVESMNVIPRGKESSRYSIILEKDFPGN